VKRFRGGLVFKAHRLLYHSTLGSTVIKKKKNTPARVILLARSSAAGEEMKAEVPFFSSLLLSSLELSDTTIYEP